MIDLLNQAGRIWSEHFLLMIVQNTIFIAVIFAILYLLRNASARVRHGIALVGLFKLISPPLLAIHTTSAPLVLDLQALEATPLTISTASAGMAGIEPAALTLAGIVFVVWCVVALAILSSGFLSTVGLRTSLRRSQAADDGDSAEWSRRTGIQVRVSSRVAVPMTVGLFPRAIFVPPYWSQLSSTSRIAVLRHEQAHIQRRDGLIKAVEMAVRALYWFNPLALLLVRRLDAYREQACDDQAAPPGRKSRLTYSRQLVEIAEHLVQRGRVPGSAFTLMRRRSELLGRVNYLTKEESLMTLSKIRFIALVFVLITAILSLSWYQGTAKQPAPDRYDNSQIKVKLSSDENVIIDGKKATMENLGRLLREKTDFDDPIVKLVCDNDVKMSTLFQVHSILRSAEMLKVSYSGMDGNSMPLKLPNEKVMKTARSLPAELVARIQVHADGKYTLDGKKINPDKLHSYVADRLAEREGLVVAVSMAAEATYNQYVHVLKSLKTAGANRILIEEPGS